MTKTSLRSRATLPLRLACAAVVLAASGVGAARAESGGAGVGDFRVQMEKWVETRQILSQEKADWEVDKETLQATRDLLAQQKAALEAEVKELEESTTGADEERRDLLLQRGELQRSRGVLEGEIRALEEAVLALAPQLPDPLLERLEPLLVQIPADPDETKMALSQRLMNVLGVLAQAEKWNGTATFVAETRTAGGDQKVQVRTLYWGLGQAFYVDSQGRMAGVGRPGPDGWEFTTDPSLASDAKRFLDVYEGNVDVIQFVEMPVEVR